MRSFYVEVLPTADYRWPWCIKMHLRDGELPVVNIPRSKKAINTWLTENNVEYKYETGLRWYIQDEAMATMTMLKWG